MGLNFKERFIRLDSNIREGLRILNDLGSNLILFIVDENDCLRGTLTDGDIRRALLNGMTVDSGVKEAMNVNFHFLRQNGFTMEDIRRFKKENIKLLPILDDNNVILRVVELNETHSLLPIDAVIMAGGEGRRLRPYTDKIPKPLLKIGDTPIIEININRLISFGVNRIHISVLYLKEQIQDYFGDGNSKNVDIRYIVEESPLGTIGAVSLVDHYKFDTVLVMNSDILTNIDLEDFYTAFVESGADIAVASIPYQVNIPYAVFETNKGFVQSFKEKPSMTYLSNGGIYLIKKSVLLEIPYKQTFNATDLLEKVISKSGKVYAYPFYGYWLDIGKHEDFIKAQEDVKHIEF